MFVSRIHLPRRAFLRGLGATIALPLLDGMVPALSALAQTAARPVRRLGVVYAPNGMNIWRWRPATEGAAFELTPVLEPLAPFRSQLLVLSGLSNQQADAVPGEGGGDHSRGQAAFLTGVHAKKTQGPDFQAGVSMDQIAARELANDTQLASLELALESNDLVGGCELGLSCAYTGTLSWRGPTSPVPVEIDPRAIFERLFGSSDTTDPKARLERLQTERSILDSVTSDLQRLQRRVGASDRTKVADYLDSVRDIERRIQKAEEQSGRQLPLVEQPAGVPASFEEHARLMFDLMALAYQTDLTRVCTFMIGREQSTRTYPEIGVPEPHHPISHHQQRPEYLEKLAKINVFHLKIFASFLEKLRATRDGDRTLLDQVMLVYGSGLSNPDDHNHHDLPILLAGGGAGQLRGGRHIKYPLDTPLANLHLTLLDKMGVPIERLGDSTGKIELLSV
ncbi:MAG TPA: DUF1552 domain-containing protein [Vicinamibacterales bacterium]|jgi:hypothetical protein